MVQNQILKKSEDYDLVANICKILGNVNRIRIITRLEKESCSFGELMKELAINPKVLNDHLNVLIANKIVVKSYPYGVYTLTPIGHVIKQGMEALNSYITRVKYVIKEE
ncbi:MAG: winged helix-turn-helix domain-containing protein [Nitrososphaerales archaeon]